MRSFVLEWSKKSNCFHIQPLETLLARNQECFIKNKTNDYILLMVGEKEMCHNMADNHRWRLSDRADSECLTATI